MTSGRIKFTKLTKVPTFEILIFFLFSVKNVAYIFFLGVNESAYIYIQKGDCLHFDFLFLLVNNTAYILKF